MRSNAYLPRRKNGSWESVMILIHATQLYFVWLISTARLKIFILIHFNSISKFQQIITSLGQNGGTAEEKTLGYFEYPNSMAATSFRTHSNWSYLAKPNLEVSARPTSSFSLALLFIGVLCLLFLLQIIPRPLQITGGKNIRTKSNEASSSPTCYDAMPIQKYQNRE